jgi:LmbE family N-acetylglucosaminyl deacetylase
MIRSAAAIPQLPSDGMSPSKALLVLSPHIDDAVFSLGATIARAARAGAEVRVLTVFGADPHSDAASEWWDKAAGFSSVGEAARARRDEDRRACALVGAAPDWLPFNDATYADPRDADEIWARLVRAIDGADAVLVPGYPLAHVDHAWLARLVFERGLAGVRVGLYAEEPYAWRAWQHHRSAPAVPEELRGLIGGSVSWHREPATLRDRLTKLRASRAYVSQVPMFGRLPMQRLLLHESLCGGEAIAWLS